MSAVDASTAAFTKQLVESAASPYQRVSGFAWRFARGKLARDPLFATLLRIGAIPDASCLVDLGCGQGLLAAWVHAARDSWLSTATHADWPTDWPAPPKVGTYLGVDQSRYEIKRAKAAMPAFARVFRGDMRTLGMTMLDRCDVVTLFDALQYLDPAAQERLLTAIATSLPPWGVLVMRVGDGNTLSSLWIDVVDFAVCALRGHPRWRVYRRSVAGWRELLERNGFTVEVLHDERDADATARRAFAHALLRASRPEPAMNSKPMPAAALPEQPLR
jgi:hypothetical protein